MKQAVLFILFQKNLILMEERYFPSLGKTHLVFPGGGVEEGESLEDALIREAKEELGVDIKEFQELKAKISYPHKSNLEISAFLITKWQGKIPNRILDPKDENNLLIWTSLEKALLSPLERVQLITKEIKSL